MIFQLIANRNFNPIVCVQNFMPTIFNLSDYIYTAKLNIPFRIVSHDKQKKNRIK